MSKGDPKKIDKALLSDLHKLGRDIYYLAYERSYPNGKIPRIFIGKKIGNLALTIFQHYDSNLEQPTDYVVTESLTVAVAKTDKYHHVSSERKISTATILGQKAVGESLIIDKPEQDLFDVAWTRNNDNRNNSDHVCTYTRQLDSNNLESAVEMAKRSLKYVSSTEYLQEMSETSQFSHKFAIKFSYDMAFTGFEGLEYLARIQHTLTNEIEKLNHMLKKIESHNLPTEEIEDLITVRFECLKRVEMAIADNLVIYR